MPNSDWSKIPIAEIKKMLKLQKGWMENIPIVFNELHCRVKQLNTFIDGENKKDDNDPKLITCDSIIKKLCCMLTASHYLIEESLGPSDKTGQPMDNIDFNCRVDNTPFYFNTVHC